jgi:hypothetical protein
MELFRTDRPLRMWDYSATHSTLSLTGTSEKRVEVSFTMTSSFKLTCWMDSLLVRDPHEHELSVLEAETGLSLARLKTTSSRVFVMETGERVGWVVAQSMLAYETAETWYARDLRNVPADAVLVSKRGVITWGERGKWAMPGFGDV